MPIILSFGELVRTINAADTQENVFEQVKAALKGYIPEETLTEKIEETIVEKIEETNIDKQSGEP